MHSGKQITGLHEYAYNISNKLYKRHELYVGLSVEEIAKESCMKAAQEEKRLVIENIDKLCEIL